MKFGRQGGKDNADIKLITFIMDRTSLRADLKIITRFTFCLSLLLLAIIAIRLYMFVQNCAKLCTKMLMWYMWMY
jgi:hypothetical protein